MEKKRQRGFSLIELLIVVAIIGIIAAIAVPKLLVAQQAARETAAFTEVQTLGKSQILYSATRGRGKYGDLAALGTQGLVDTTLASGNKGGYIFATTPIDLEGMRPMFDTTAKPSSIGTFGTGNRCYYSNEALLNTVYEADGDQPPTATPQDRLPKNGTPRSD